MAMVEKSVLVGHPASELFRLVDDVARYPEFLPWCGGAETLPLEDGSVRATLHIRYHGIRQSFTTENRRQPPDSIEIRLVSGPFRHLDGHWRFIPLGDAGCKVVFRLHYEFSSRLLEKLVGPVFHHIANTFVDAFVKRASQPASRT